MTGLILHWASLLARAVGLLSVLLAVSILWWKESRHTASRSATREQQSPKPGQLLVWVPSRTRVNGEFIDRGRA